MTAPLAGEEAEHAAPVVLLVVEDDEFTRRLIHRMLDPLHFEAHFAGDGAEALKMLRELRPDVVLMDIRMPGLHGGLALTRMLKATPQLREIPVIMMTGDVRRETVLHSMQAGAVAFIVKPFERDALLLKLRAVRAARTPVAGG